MNVSAEPEVQPPGASETVVRCPKCQARNNPSLARCSVCGADLLPGRRRREHLGGAILGLVFAAALMALAAVLPQLMHGPAAPATPTPQPTATPSPSAVFREDFLTFSYPADWWRIGPWEVNFLLKTSLTGMTADPYRYIGGVYTEGLDNCRACAQILVIVTTEPSLAGTLTEAQYQAIRAASEQTLGARLLSHRKVEVSSMPAAESIHLDPSGDSKVWEFIIVPPQPGVAYRFSCSSHKDSFEAFEPVFREAISTLHIAGDAPTPVPTPVRTATPLPVASPRAITYTIQEGDTLSQIAKDLGVPLDALAEVNDIEDPDLIGPGQVLTIPLGAQ